MNSSQRNRVRITRLNSTIITGCMRRDMPRPPAKSGPRLVPHGNRVGTNTHFRHGLGQKAGAAEPARIACQSNATIAASPSAARAVLRRYRRKLIV